MEAMNIQSTSLVKYRTDKTIAWLMESRDEWKLKCMQAKLKLKRQTLALKRSRDVRSQQKITFRSLLQRNLKLELIVQTQQEQLSELKKKYSSKKM
jgi:hypothetical protein